MTNPASFKNFYKLFILFGFTSQLAAQVEVKNVSKQLIITNEPSIVVDPFEGRVLIGSNVDNIFLSTNGGVSFEERKLRSTFGVYGDPIVFINQNGTYFYAHLAKAEGKKAPEMWDRIVVQKSTDFGDSFLNGIGVGFVEGKMQDKHSLTGDLNKKSPYFGRLYLAWTEFDKYQSKATSDSSRIKFAYSENEADSFSEPVVISDTAGDCLDGDNTAEGVSIATGKYGELYAVWAARGKIYMDISYDGGATWGVDKIIAQQIDGWDQNIPFISRANSMPVTFCDKKGYLHVVFGDKRYGDYDIFMLSSEDQGLTFKPIVRVNKDAIGNGRDQFMPNVSYDRLKGCFYILYYTREQSMLNLFTEAKLAYGKKSTKIKDITLSKIPFAPSNKQFFGDYIGVNALNNAVGAVWTEVDYETNRVTLKTAIAPAKMFFKHKPNYVGNVNEFVLLDSNIVYINYHIAENNGYKIEVTRYGKTVYQRNQIDAVSPGNYEEKLKIDLVSGTYEIKITYKGRTFSKSFTIR